MKHNPDAEAREWDGFKDEWLGRVIVALGEGDFKRTFMAALNEAHGMGYRQAKREGGKHDQR